MKALAFLKEYKELITSSHEEDWFDIKTIDECIAELEALQQPKSCEKCKYFKEHDRYQLGICEKGHADSTRGGLYTVDYDFCCNKYEAKDEQ